MIKRTLHTIKAKFIAASVIVIISLAILPVMPTFAAVCTATASGNWSSVGTWSCGYVPTSADDVAIANGVTVNLDVASVKVNSLILVDGNASTTLNLNGNTLEVTNDLNVQNTNATGNTKTVAVGTGTLTVDGNLIVNENTQVAKVTISTGTVNVIGNIMYNLSGTKTNAQIVFSGAGALNVTGNFPSGMTLTPSTGTVNFKGAAQTVPLYTYNNLILSGSGVKTLPGFSGSIGGALTLSGTVSATTTSNVSVTGALNVNSGSSLTIAPDYTLAVTGVSTVVGTLNLGGIGTKTFTGATTINSGGALNVTGSGAVTFTGALTVNSGGTYNEAAAATVVNAGNLTDNGTYTANSGTHTFNGATAGKTISGSSIITIPSLNLAGTTVITVSGNLYVPTSLSTGVAVTNSGTINAPTMTVGTAAFTNSGKLDSSNLTLNAGLTNSGTLNASNSLSIANGITLTNSATGVLNFGGSSITTAGTGTINASAAGNLVNYNAAGDQTVFAIPYSALILSGSGNKTMGSTSITTGGNLDIMGSAKANLTSNTGNINNLALSGAGVASGTWGSTSSGAVHQENTHFTAGSTGKLNTVQNTDVKLNANVAFGAAPAPTYLGGTFTTTATKTSTATLAYSVVSGPCVLVTAPNTFNSTGAGTCVVAAYTPSNAAYEAGWATQSITIAQASQQALTISAAATTVVAGSTTTLSASGGSGTGAVTYNTNDVTACSVSGGNILTVNDASKTCTVTATKAADSNYLAASSAPLSITPAYYQVEINKQFSPPNIQPNGISHLSITLYNPNGFQLLNAGWSDNLVGIQPGIRIAATPNIQNNPLSGGCGGTVTAPAGGTSISLSGGTVPAKAGNNGQCTVTVDVTSNTPGNLVNTIQAGTVSAQDALSKLASNTTPANATLQVYTIIPPTIDKNFNANTIYAGAASTLTINIRNQDPSYALTNASLADNLPANVTVVTPLSSASVSLTFSAAKTITRPPGGSFLTDGFAVGQTISTSSATNPGPFTITAVTAMQITVSQAVTAQIVTGVVNKYSASSGCGSLTYAPTAGAGSISMTGATIPLSQICTLTVMVTSTTQGAYIDTIPAGAIQDDQSITNGYAAVAALNVQQLNITKSFAPGTINPNGTSLVTITFFNPTSTPYTNMSLTDTLPANMTAVSSPAPGTTCTGGTVINNSTSIQLINGTLAGGTPSVPASCTVTFTVTAPASVSGALVNTIPANSLTDTQGISNPFAVAATLTVNPALTVSKSIFPSAIVKGNPSTVTVTLNNISGTQVTGVSMTDNLPTIPAPGLVVYGTPTSNQCGASGLVNATATSVSLTNGTINANSNCTVVFQITSNNPVLTTYTNNIGVGGLCGYAPTSICNTVASNNATLQVAPSAVPITGTKVFGTTSIAPGGTSVLTITFNAPGDTTLSNISLNDTFPTGMKVASPPVASLVSTSGTCTGTFTPLANDTVLHWTNGTTTAGAVCTLKVTVTSSTPGTATNTINTTDIIDNEGRVLNTALSAQLNVSNFTVSKAFYPPVTNANGISTLTITLDNANLIPLTNLSLSDLLTTLGAAPNNVLIAPAPNAFTSCGGNLTAAAGTSTISLANASVPAKMGGVDGICTINVDVKAFGVAGTRTDTITNTTVTASLAGVPIYAQANATATLTILPLSITVNKSFDTLTVFGGSASTMRIRLTNPNNAILTGINFTDSMPSGMYIAAPANLSTGSCGGTLTGVSGSNTFSFSGGSLAVAPAYCELTLGVTMNVNGNLTNTIPAGAVTAANGAANPQAAQATLTNLGGVSVHKWFNPTSMPLGSNSTLTIQIVNISNFPLTNVSLPDTLPTNLVIANYGSVNLCGGSLTADPGTGLIAVSTPTIAANSSCTITIPVTSSITSCYTNTIPINAITDNEGQSNTTAAQDTVCINGNVNIATTPSAAGPTGTTLNDTANLTGGNSPTGTVTFKLYPPTDPSCLSTPIYTKVVSGSSPYQTSPGFVTNAAGTWHWKALYSGDANNSPVTSACTDEPVIISKTTATIATSAQTTTGTVGVAIPSIGDRVTSMSGAYNATGNITFTLYSDATCSTAVTGMTGSGSISGGTVSWTTSWTPPAPGTYYWGTSYVGDVNNGAATSCGGAGEQVTINKATPTLTTTAVAGPLAVGSPNTDTAHLGGGYGTLGGTVSFNVFAPSDVTCSTPIPVSPARSVNGAGNYTSANYTTTVVGSYRWNATYSGDANNAAVSSLCTDAGESSVIVKASPVLNTAASGPVALGSSITDTAHLSGVIGNLSGTISFNVYAPGDSSCNTPIAVTPAATVIGSGDYISAAYSTTLVGDYHWIASYSGDGLNNATYTACNDAGETSTVNNLATPTLTTTAFGPVTVGDSIHDVAHLGGGFGTLGGTIIFKVYAPGDDTCTTPIAVTPDVTVTGANDYTSGSFPTTAAGAYRWQAFYSGDTYNNAVSTGCYDSGETSTANRMIPTLTTTASGPVTVGGSITDTAHLGGGYGILSGTISFDVYAPGDSSCVTPTSVDPDILVSGTGDYTSAAFTTLAAGTYRWRATYSGDANNAAASTACNDSGESSTVNQATPTLTTTASGPVTIGGPITDLALLSGGFGTLGGTISFKMYAPGDATCSTPASVPLDVSVNGDGDYLSAAYTTAILGTYRWRAFYSGDGNNIAVSTGCNDAGESSTTTQATPTITTTASGPVTVGGNIMDTAHLSGGFGTLGGTISFKVYAPGDDSCSTAISVLPDITVSGANNYTSADFTTLAAGSFRWRAFYSGDTNNIAVNTACGDSGETSTVNQATPTLTTTASGPVTMGQSITDTAHLSGGFGTVGGSISFNIYAPGDIHCFTPTTVISNITVIGTGDYTSTAFTTLAVGTYRWRATYSGDSNNNGFTTGCNDSGESSTVNQATPTLITAIHDTSHATITSIPANIAFHDSASFSGSPSPLPTGNVTFTFFTSADCSSGGTDAGTLALVSGVADPSTLEGPVGAGSYSFMAHYNGDTNYLAVNSTCEPLTVNRASPGISTTASPDVGTVGTSNTFGDSASLSGAYSPTGSVTFSLYGDLSCSTAVPTMSGSGAISGTTASWSNSWTPPATGTYYWKAYYPGDGNNNAYTSTCGPTSTNEQITVGQATPVVTTSIHNASHSVVTAVLAGATVHDSASVTGGGVTPSGSVNFNFFNNGTCTAPAAASSSAFSLSSGSVDATTFTQATLAAGSYSFQAHYSGDVNYAAGDGACEPLTVNMASPTISTTASPTIGAIGMAVTAGDSATLISGNNPTGSVTFTLYSDSSCTTAVSGISGSGLISGGSANWSKSWTPTAAGTYYWQASYPGDSQNNGYTSTCNAANEEIIIQAIPMVTTQLSPSQPIIGTQVHDTTTLSGATSNAGGTVTYMVYSDDQCTQNAQNAGTVTVTNGTVPNSNDITFSASGTYYWVVSYSGDAYNQAAISGCGSEMSTVTPVTVSYFLAQRQGNSVNFVWSTATETGNVGFNLYVKASGKLTKVNTDLIPSQVIDSLDRQDYTYSARVNGSVFYIEDVSIRGDKERFGPFQVGQSYGAQLAANKINWAAIQSEHASKQTASQNALKQGMASANAGVNVATAAVTATRTPTPTKVFTPTRTPTRTKTPTRTATIKPLTPTKTPTSTKTFTPTKTSRVTATATSKATATPTATPVPPTATSVPPTATPVPPTATSVPPTATLVPPTATSVPPTGTDVPPADTSTAPTDVPPTDTAVPPTATSVPPTDTSVPETATDVPPTDTSMPPTATNVAPTDTPVPPTVTSVPPMDTSIAPTATDVPTATPVDTDMPTATYTPTATFTPSATYTATATATATAVTPAPTGMPFDPASLQLTTTYNFKVSRTGIYRVTYETLLAAGLDLAGVPVREITVLNQNQMIPVYVTMPGKAANFGAGGYIEFYGQALDTMYTGTNIYTVQVSTGTVNQLPIIDATPGQGLSAPVSYSNTNIVNRQLYYASSSPSTEAWYDTAMLVYMSSKSWNFTFQVNGLADSSSTASFDLDVWGMTALPQNPDHHLLVSVNGLAVANDRFDGMVDRDLKISLPAGSLHEGANTLQLTLPGDTGAAYDLIYLNKYSITYPRVFQAQNGQLTFSGAGTGFSVSNLSTGNIVVYRLNPGGEARLANVQVQGSGSNFTASFAGSTDAATYLVTTVEAMNNPVLEAMRAPGTNLNQPAQYLVISAPDFISGLTPLVQYHQAQGLTVKVVDVNDLYAKYTYGIFDPSAIKQYIANAAKNLGTKYVLLVGGDTYDYRNYLGKNSISFIPSLYTTTNTDAKFVPADPLYADLNGDNLPDLAIGRLPVRSMADLNVVISKTLMYAGKMSGGSAVFASDANDGTVSFKDLSNGLAANLPSNWSVQSIHVDDIGVDAAYPQLVAAMNNGPALVMYTGHSGPQSWAVGDIFDIYDAVKLTNTGKPFVVVQWGCWNTYYVDPVNVDLVQSFLFSGNNGAAAVLGASTLTNSGSEALLGALLMPRLVTPGMPIGQALLVAKSELAKTHPEMLDVLLGWSLMGDPALVIQP